MPRPPDLAQGPVIPLVGHVHDDRNVVGMPGNAVGTKGHHDVGPFLLEYLDDQRFEFAGR